MMDKDKKDDRPRKARQETQNTQSTRFRLSIKQAIYGVRHHLSAEAIGLARAMDERGKTRSIVTE